MKVHVEFLNDEHTKARITLVPGWLGRLFGAKTRTGEAARMGYHREWAWTSTSRNVGRAIVRELELQEVADLPRVTVMHQRSRCNCTRLARDMRALRAFGVEDPITWLCATCGLQGDKPTEAA